MKRALLCIVVLFTLTSATYAAGPVGFGVHANYVNVNVPEPLKDVYGPGWGGGAHLDLNFLPFVGVKISGDYLSISPDQDKYRAILTRLIPGSSAAGFSLDGGRITIISGSANAKIGFGIPIVTPYATGGVGLASLTVSDMSVSFQGQPLGSIPSAETGTKFSANLGAGVDLNLVAVKLYVEAKYTWIFSEGEKNTYIPVSVGITF